MDRVRRDTKPARAAGLRERALRGPQAWRSRRRRRHEKSGVNHVQQVGLCTAREDRTRKGGFKRVAVTAKMVAWLAKERGDLRHFVLEDPVCRSQLCVPWPLGLI